MSGLFDAIEIRGVSIKNRIAVSPMSQYRAKNGFANDWHLVHLGRFALGGAGLVFAEATAVQAEGRRTHGDLGLWEDQQIDPLIPITRFIAGEGATPGIQLGHAGRKASERRPWHGETPVDQQDVEERNEAPWTAMGPSPIPYADGWPVPVEMSEADIADTLQAFGSAARRSKEAGFKVIEIYAAHGFLVHQFLSPIANKRTDKWGGDITGRCRFAVEVAKAVRNEWPEEYPLIFRLSATDWLEGGLEVDDVIEIARALASEGVDMIDCSSGGVGGRERPRRMKIEQGFQVPFAACIREEAGIATMAVGFLWDADYCQTVIEKESADMIAMARELLDDPNWPLHAAASLGKDTGFSMWHDEFGYWLEKRDRLSRKLELR